MLAGCSANNVLSTSTHMQTNTASEFTEALSESKHNSTGNNCTLIVNGKDLTSSTYVYLHRDIKEAELPLTVILQELGADLRRLDDTIIVVKFGDSEQIIVISLFDFGLPQTPGSRLFVRKIVNNEVIMDKTSATIYIVHWMGAEMTINYEDRIIEIKGQGDGSVVPSTESQNRP